jgi:hypothetical protein
LQLDSAAPRSEPAAKPAFPSDLAPPATFALLAVGSLAIGLVLVGRGPFGFRAADLLGGVGSQLATTVPAAVLIALATGLNVVAGAILIWAATGRAYRSVAELALSGFVGAVLLDLLLLGALGGTGTFRWPILVVVHGAILAAGHLLRLRRGNLPLLDPLPRPGAPPWWPVWLVVGLSWVGLVALQLASPVVPFVDVLPNHVAPVEHLRTFGGLASLTTTASPIYGPSRTFLGYVALLGTIDTLATVPAALGVAAFALPGAVFVTLGIHRLGGAIGGGRAGSWAALAFILTTSFVRLPDARATVLVLPLACWSLALLADRMAGQADARQGPFGSPRAQALLLGAALAATILMHPVIGALTVLTAGFAVLMQPPVAEVGVPALATAGLLSLPQLATMVELELPTVAALVVIPPAILVGWLLAIAPGPRQAIVVVARVLTGIALVGALVAAPTVLPAAAAGLDKLIPTIPILVVTTLAGLLVAPRRYLVPVLAAGLLAGVVAATAMNLVPAQGTLMTALRFEVPKTLHYWLHVIFVVGAAFGLDSAWGGLRLPPLVARAAIAIFLLVVVLPLRPAPLTDAYYLGERRLSETVSLQLRQASLGYWTGYPDSRRLIDADGQAIVAALRSEIDAGRLTAGSGVLHVARSFQQWVAIPLGVMTGVVEADVTPDAEVSIHTVGGRLHPFADLDSLLRADYPYLVLEPAGLPATVRPAVVAAGYRSIFANGRGEVFVRGQ